MKGYSRNRVFLFLLVLPGYVSAEIPDSSGTLIVSSVPDQAKVYVGGVSQGVTPLTIEGFVVGKWHHFRVERYGYKPYSDSLLFSAPTVREKDIVLAPKEMCVLAISSALQGVKIFVDDIYQGVAPLTIEGLELHREYTVKAEKDGRKLYSDWIMFEFPGKLTRHIIAAAKTDMGIGACSQARQDARDDVDRILWWGAGCIGGVLGLGAAWMYTKPPPPYRVAGRPPNYVSLYTRCYMEEVKKIQTEAAGKGCLLSAVGCLIGTRGWWGSPSHGD